MIRYGVVELLVAEGHEANARRCRELAERARAASVHADERLRENLLREARWWETLARDWEEPRAG